MSFRSTDGEDLADPAMVVRSKAMMLLANREYAREELARRLEAAGFNQPWIDTVLDDLERDGLQSDSRFAEAFVHGRLVRGYGPRRIRQELAQRGVSGELAETALETYREEWGRHLDAARRKRFGSDLPHASGELARQARFLINRGFEPERVRRALRGRDD